MVIVTLPAPPGNLDERSPVKNRLRPAPFRQSRLATTLLTRSFHHPASLLGGGLLALLVSPAALAVCVTDMNQLQGIGTNATTLDGTYELCADIDATGVAFVPLGDATNHFSGTFDGQGHVITGLTINTPANDYVGLFGVVGLDGVVKRVGLVDGSVSGNLYTGLLAGVNVGLIQESYASGSASGVGDLGGLVGLNYFDVGEIKDSYATVAVQGTGSAIYGTVGGLVGENGGSVTSSYASGSVSAAGIGGGLIGYSFDGSTSGSYWDTVTSGLSVSADGVGKTTTQLMAALPVGFDTGIWGNGDNQTTPYLKALNHNAVRTVNDTANLQDVVQNLDQLQAINQNLGGRYVLGNDIDASATSTWNAGAGFAPLGGSPTAFSGQFDGLGHTISNLFIDSAVIGASVGLFGKIAAGVTLRNVGLLDADITGITAVGTLLGLSSSADVISHSYADGGRVTGMQGVGGLVGSAGGLTIDHSYANVEVLAQGGNTATVFAGGLAGGGTLNISYSYAAGSVTGETAVVGGLVGTMSGGSISHSYAFGAVSSTTNPGGGLGGLVGPYVFDGSFTVTNSYWDETTTGQLSSADGGSGNTGTGLTTAEWTTIGPFGAAPADGAWDTNDWVEGNPYPGIKSLPYITITANASQTYGSAALIATGDILDQNLADASTLVDVSGVTWTAGSTLTSVAGTTVDVAGAGATITDGYQLLYTGSLTVAKAPLTITATDASKVYDGMAYTGGNGVTYSGFVNGETEAVLGGTLVYGGSSQGAINTGTYDITLSGMTAANYSLSYTNGALNITAAPDPEPSEVVANSGTSLTLTDLTPVIALPGSTLVIPPGVNLDGISITLQGSSGDNGSITFRIGSLTLTLSNYVDGTALSLKQVLVNGVKTQVLVVTGGELDLGGNAGQPLVTLNDSVVLSAGENGSTLRFSAPDEGDGSGSIAVTKGRILISDDGAETLIGDGLIYHGEVADFDRTGQIVRLRLASAPGASGGVGDPLTLDFASNLIVGSPVPQLNGDVGRLGGSLVQALAQLVGAELSGPQTDGLLIFDLGDRQLHALPVGDILIDTTRENGLTTEADGLVSAAIDGVVVRFAPVLPGLMALVQALPEGAVVTVRDGLLLAEVEGQRYVLRPSWNGQAAPGAGLGESNGELHYTWQGLRYALHAAFADYESVVDVVEQELPGATAFTQDDGSVLVLAQDGTSLLLVPARTLASDVEAEEGALWWRGADGTLYLRNTDGSVQAFQLLPL
jgi:hypothetical protein